MKKLIALLAFFALVAESQVSVPIAVNKWQLWNRAVGQLPIHTVAGGGIGFNFEVSAQPDPNAGPTWDGYLISVVHNISLLPSSEIVVTFQLDAATSGVTWNGRSDSFNTCGSPPPNFRVYVQKSDGRCVNKSPFSGCYPPQLRWWSDPGKFVLTDTAGVVELHIPLTPENWIETDGVRGDDPVFNQYWTETMNDPSWVGITFGAFCFAGHGVNVTLDAGTPVPEFKLLSWRTQ